jgi:hypothetical protein
MEVRSWIERKDTHGLRLVAEVSLPSSQHVPQTKISLRLDWPANLGRVGEVELPASLRLSTATSEQSLSAQIGASVPAFASVTLGGALTANTTTAASPEYGLRTGRVVELSGFSKILGTEARYRVAFPIEEAAGYVSGARLRWRTGHDLDWQPVEIDSSGIWAAEIDQRLPGYYWSFRGRVELRKRVRQLLTNAGESQAILVTGPGGIGKTAMVRAVLTSFDKLPWSRLLGFTARGKFFSAQEGLSVTDKEVPGLRDMYRMLAEELVLPWDGRELDRAHAMVRERLAAQRKVLFVLDNIESAEEFEGLVSRILTMLPPPPAGQMIITSREELAAPAGAMTLVKVSRLEASDIEEIVLDVVFNLYTKTRSLERSVLDDIIDRSEGHPLSAIFFTHAHLSGETSKLRQASSREALLTFCFEAQWQRLNDVQRGVLKRPGHRAPRSADRIA